MSSSVQSSITAANHTCCSQDNLLCIKTAAPNLFRSLQHNPLSAPSRELMRGEGKKGKVWTSTASNRDLNSFFQQNSTSKRWELTFFPFFIQVMRGLGSPTAWHTNDATPPEIPVWSSGDLMKLGMPTRERWGGSRHRWRQHENNLSHWNNSCKHQKMSLIWKGFF